MIKHQRIRLLNKPKLNVLDKIEKLCSLVKFPVKTVINLGLGLVDPTGIAEAGLDIASKSINLGLAYRNKKIHNEWLSQMGPAERPAVKAQTLLKQSEQRFNSLVDSFEQKGMSREEAIQIARKAETKRVMVNNAKSTLINTTKKIHDIHSFFLNFAVIKAAVKLGTSITTKAAGCAIKIAALAGGISAPAAYAVEVPLKLISAAVSVISGSISLGASIRFRPQTFKEKLRGTGIKLALNKLALAWHKHQYENTIKKVNDTWKLKVELEQKLGDSKRSPHQKLKNKIKAAHEKMDRLEAQHMHHMIKANKFDFQALKCENRLIEAGWKDARSYLKITPATEKKDYADLLGQWFVDEHKNNNLDDSLCLFLKDQMAIDIEDICQKYPGQEAQAITYHIKEHFAKNENKMLKHINSQLRKKKTQVS